MKKIFVIIVALLALVSCNMDFYSSDSMTSSQLADNPSSAVYTTDGLYTLLKERIAYKGRSGGESGNYYIRHYFDLNSWLLMAIGTLFIGVYILKMTRRDFPLSGLPVVGKYFKK